MLPRETTVRQLKKLREETKGKDIGDLTTKDRLNINTPNLQYIGNPTSHLQSWEDFTEKDNKLQTIAFKSKLVNKPLVKENKKEIMKNDLKNLISLDDFQKNWKPEEAKKTKRTEVAKDVLEKKVEQPTEKVEECTGVIATKDVNNLISFTEFSKKDNTKAKATKRTEVAKDVLKEGFYDTDELETEDEAEKDEKEIDWEDKDMNPLYFEEYDKLPEEEDEFEEEDLELAELEENIKTFEAFQLKDVVKQEVKQPEYTMLGEEKPLKENPIVGAASVIDQNIKKIGSFTNSTKVIDPKTPKARPILNAGQFVHTEKVRGYVNRVEGNKVFVESLDEPMKIVEISIKDAIKPPIKQEETIKRFDEIVADLNKEFLKDK